MTKFFKILKEATSELHKVMGEAKAKNLLDNSKSMHSGAWKWHNKAFGTEHHVEFDLPHEVPEKVKEHVQSNGGEIDDSGHKVKLKSGREVPTSKFLGKSGAPNHVTTDYQHFSKNNKGNTKLVISRHPGEVASCSTGTLWDSCANMSDGDGAAAYKMPKELEHGTMIAMHLHKDAKKNKDGEYDSKDVLGRRLIKRYDTDNNESAYYQEEKSYGQFPKAAIKKVHEFTTKHNPEHYIALKEPSLYNDDATKTKSQITKGNIDAASKHSNPKIRLAASESEHLGHKHIAKLINDKSTTIAISAMMNKNASPENIHKGLDSGNVEVKAAAASNINANNEHLEKALNDESRHVRGEAAGNVNISTHLLNKALADPAESVKNTAARNKNLSPEIIDKIVNNSDSDVQYKAHVLSNPNSTPEILHKALKINHGNIYHTASKHPNISAKSIDKIIDSGMGHYGLSENPKTSKEHIHKLLHTDNSELKIYLSAHPNFDHTHVHAALDDEDDDVRFHALSSGKANQSNFRKASKDPSKSIRDYAKDRLTK